MQPAGPLLELEGGDLLLHELDPLLRRRLRLLAGRRLDRHARPHHALALHGAPRLIDRVLQPSSKVLSFQRSDTTKRERVEDAGFGSRTTKLPPTWHSPQADTNVVTVDGSVTTVDMQALHDEVERETELPEDQRVLTPPHLWTPSNSLLGRYSMDEDNLENGSSGGVGRYPAFFWSTRDGVRGYDFIR